MRATLPETLSGGGAQITPVSRVYGDVATPEGLSSVAERDAKGSLTVHWLDALRREVKTVDAEGHALVTAWDAVNRRAVRDRNLNDTTYEYDGANRIVLQQDLARDGSVLYHQRFAYDDAARRQTAYDRKDVATDPKQQQVVSAYDVLDRLGSKTWFYGALPTEFPAISGIAYVYDEKGNLQDQDGPALLRGDHAQDRRPAPEQQHRDLRAFG